MQWGYDSICLDKFNLCLKNTVMAYDFADNCAIFQRRQRDGEKTWPARLAGIIGQLLLQKSCQDFLNNFSSSG
jgi:hypothetical protein